MGQAFLMGQKGTIKPKVVGLQWDQSKDTYARLEDASGQSRSYFDNLYPWAGMKRCILSDSGQVVAYYGDVNYTEDGSTGQVMVRIPKFYYFAKKIDSVYRWYISPNPQLLFKVHPAFVS